MISQTLMALPVIALYEVSIWISYLVKRKREERAEEEGI
jgi:sec-independent protein translocase protein TatC